MGKISIYLQDEIHAENFYKFLSKNRLVLDAYVNSEEYNEAINMGAEHIHDGVAYARSQEDDKYHLEIIIKNGSSRDYNLPERKRKS